MKRKERRQLGVVSGMEADESDVVTEDKGADGNGDGDGDGESGGKWRWRKLSVSFCMNTKFLLKLHCFLTSQYL